MTTRRRFVSGAGALAAMTVQPMRSWSQSATSAGLHLTINTKLAGATMPLDFTGLSYETSQLGHPNFFSGRSAELLSLFRRLGAEGVLRIGGNTSDSSIWKTNENGGADGTANNASGPDLGAASPKATVVTAEAIRNLNDFIRKLDGWKIIYGLDLQHGTPENAAAEAAYVAQTLGSRLICFQIGNEPDMAHYPDSTEKYPKNRWSFDYYWDRWQKFQAAVKVAVPDARFGGPDVARKSDWAAKITEKGAKLVLLSGHYYAEGPPENPKMTLEYLLRRGADPAKAEIPMAEAVMKASSLPFRMTEANSCYHGGKPLVSNTLASALWGGDFMLQLAQAGYAGVNFHGGGNGLYTPIAGDPVKGFTARPVFYGMLLAERFVGTTFVDAQLSAQSEAQNTTAFATIDGVTGRLRLAIFNKAPDAITLRIDGMGKGSKGAVQWLKAPAIDSLTGVTLGGSTVGPHGDFSPHPQDELRVARGSGSIAIPGYTAAYIET